jgi:hypothetical protein
MPWRGSKKDGADAFILAAIQGALSKGPRYAVYDVQYDLASGEGTRYAASSREQDTSPVLETNLPRLQQQDHLHRLVAG